MYLFSIEIRAILSNCMPSMAFPSKILVFLFYFRSLVVPRKRRIFFPKAASIASMPTRVSS